MKSLILAGGYGTRLSEYTDSLPKPMVKIGGMPILQHINNIYLNYNIKDFYIVLGYKSEIIIKYFYEYAKLNKKNFNYVKSTKNETFFKFASHNITLLETGDATMTGGRVTRFKKYLDKDKFFMTYGDGVSDININKLLSFHEKNNKIATITAVRPPARFGYLEIKEDIVTKFKEKSQIDEGWINGGFFIFEPEIFDYITDDKTILEKEPLENLSLINQLYAYKHYGFWQCMDTKRDKELLDKIIKLKKAPWIKKKKKKY